MRSFQTISTAKPSTVKPLCLALLGPTASGKTSFAIELAERLNAEIVCLDSTTVYREFNIGSAKPTADQQKKITHHLIDILDPHQDFSAGQFIEHAHQAVETILARRKLPLIVGGTYFYFRALQHGMYPVPPIAEEVVEQIEKEFSLSESVLDEKENQTQRMHTTLMQLDPKAAENIHHNDRYRLVRALAVIKSTGQKISELEPAHKEPEHGQRLWLKYSMAVSRHTLFARIVQRTDNLIAQGLVEETKHLIRQYPKARALRSIGYHEAAAYLNGALNEKGMRNAIIEKTRQLAKRQLTWIRNDVELRFIDHRDTERVIKEVENLTYVLKEPSCNL